MDLLIAGLAAAALLGSKKKTAVATDPYSRYAAAGIPLPPAGFTQSQNKQTATLASFLKSLLGQQQKPEPKPAGGGMSGGGGSPSSGGGGGGSHGAGNFDDGTFGLLNQDGSSPNDFSFTHTNDDGSISVSQGESFTTSPPMDSPDAPPDPVFFDTGSLSADLSSAIDSGIVPPTFDDGSGAPDFEAGVDPSLYDGSTDSYDYYSGSGYDGGYDDGGGSYDESYF